MLTTDRPTTWATTRDMVPTGPLAVAAGAIPVSG